MLRLSHFPDLCLLSIFAHLPLVVLIRTVGQVCTNWTRVQKDELRRRRTLTLLQNTTQIEDIQANNPFESNLTSHVRRDDGTAWAASLASLNQIAFNTLLVPGVLKFTSQLIQLLPQITHLTVMQWQVSANNPIAPIAHVIQLIDNYRLISLRLDFSYNRFVDIETLPNLKIYMYALFDSINLQESTLKHLTLRLYFQGLSSTPKPMTILSRLESFTILGFYPSQSLYDSFQLYSTENDRIEVAFDEQFLLEPLLEIKNPHNFTRINIGTNLLNSQQCCNDMKLVGRKFTSLKSLTLRIFSMPMTMLTRCLPQLPELVHLKLNFYTITQDEPNPVPHTQVASVRLLTLTFSTESHHDTTRLHLHELFPNLQVLHLFQSAKRCDVCSYEQRNVDDVIRSHRNRDELLARIVHCMRLARQTFRQCGQLHTIKLDIRKELQGPSLVTVDQL